MFRVRPPSLFWTFAGSFLLVLVAAAVLQGLVIVAVVQPVVARWTADRARLIVREVAQQIEASAASFDEEAIRSILAARPPEGGTPLLVFRAEQGALVAAHPIPPPLQERVESLVNRDEDGVPERGAFRSPRDGRRRDLGRGARPGPPGPPGGPPDFRQGPPGEAERAFLHGPLEVASRHPVEFSSGEAGVVVALSRVARFGELLPRATPRRALLFLPIAVLLAATAGLIMFRALLGRLRALEALAARVADGDLGARVPDPGTDEIGRLGARLNSMTEALASARDRVDASDRQRRRLLADVSHELATPLTSIRGYAETLLDPGVPVSSDERAAYLRNVLEESERMDLLIEDLFDLTRLEAGANEWKTERLDWAALCRNTMVRFESRYREAGLDLSWGGAEEPAWIEADGRRLEQVIENLLSNALRYVPRDGSVVVSVERVAGGAPRYRLTVEDDGPGIPDADLPHVFDRFYRADSARATPGTGLGLAIVKEIVTRHGGTIRAARGATGGSSFQTELFGATVS